MRLRTGRWLRAALASNSGARSRPYSPDTLPNRPPRQWRNPIAALLMRMSSPPRVLTTSVTRRRSLGDRRCRPGWRPRSDWSSRSSSLSAPPFATNADTRTRRPRRFLKSSGEARRWSGMARSKQPWSYAYRPSWALRPHQTSDRSARSSASSTFMPRRLPMLSIFAWPCRIA